MSFVQSIYRKNSKKKIKETSKPTSSVVSQMSRRLTRQNLKNPNNTDFRSLLFLISNWILLFYWQTEATEINQTSYCSWVNCWRVVLLLSVYVFKNRKNYKMIYFLTLPFLKLTTPTTPHHPQHAGQRNHHWSWRMHACILILLFTIMH